MDLHDTSQDWSAHAKREAVAILAEVGVLNPRLLDREMLVSLLASAWLQGVNYGSHATLAEVETAFDGMKAALD